MSRIGAGALCLVTGASSGLGRAMARQLVARGASVVLLARRREVLDALAAELGPQAIPLPFDLAADGPAHELPRRLTEALASRGVRPEQIDVLVNNAGAGSFGELARADRARLLSAHHLNVVVPLVLTNWLLPPMIERGGGTVVNIASVAGFSPGPLMAAYYGDKAWVLRFGASVDAEVRRHGVRVVTAAPGPFESGFHSHAGIAGDRLGRIPSAERVARSVLRAVDRGRAVAPIGVAARLWAVVGPRLPWSLAAGIIYRIQSRRAP